LDNVVENDLIVVLMTNHLTYGLLYDKKYGETCRHYPTFAYRVC